MGKVLTVPRLVAICVGLIIVWPLLVTAMPPLVDYPNHMVRFWLLTGGASQPPLSTYFQVDWSHTATNIGMDVYAVLLRTLFSPSVTGHIVLATAALLPIAGVALVSRRISGPLSWWHILLGLNAWGLLLLIGLMSFQLSLGAALIALWLDLVYAEHRWTHRWLRQITQGLIIMLIHPFGAAFYLVLITALSVGADARVLIQPKEWPELSKRLLYAWLPLAIACILIAIRVVLSRQGDGDSDFPELYWDENLVNLDHLFYAFAAPWRSYRLSVDLVFIGLLWLPVGVSLWQRRLSVHGGLATAGLALFVISLFCPQSIGSTSLVDVRLATIAALIMPLALYPDIVVKRHTTAILCTLALCIIGARSAWLTVIWQARQADIRSLYRAMDYIPVGARVVPLTVKVADDSETGYATGRYLGGMTTTFGHLSTLAVMRRHVYVPTVFAENGKQPLSVRDPFVDHHEISGGLLGTLTDLEAGDGEVATYLPYWRTDFDYVLIVNADANPAGSRIRDGACLVTDQGYAKLYHIQKTPCPK